MVVIFESIFFVRKLVTFALVPAVWAELGLCNVLDCHHHSEGRVWRSPITVGPVWCPREALVYHTAHIYLCDSMIWTLEAWSSLERCPFFPFLALDRIYFLKNNCKQEKKTVGNGAKFKNTVKNGEKNLSKTGIFMHNVAVLKKMMKYQFPVMCRLISCQQYAIFPWLLSSLHTSCKR